MPGHMIGRKVSAMAGMGPTFLNSVNGVNGYATCCSCCNLFAQQLHGLRLRAGLS